MDQTWSKGQEVTSQFSQRMDQRDGQITMDQMSSKDQEVTTGFSQRMEVNDEMLPCMDSNSSEEIHEIPQTSKTETEEIIEKIKELKETIIKLKQQQRDEHNVRDEAFDELEDSARRIQRLTERLRKGKAQHGVPQRQIKNSIPMQDDTMTADTNTCSNEKWKCKVAESLTIAQCRTLATLFKLNINFTTVPGLDLIEEVEKRNCQGPNWEDFKTAMRTAEYLDSVKIFEEYYAPSQTETVPSKPYNFQTMLKDVGNIITLDDARYIATFLKLTDTEKHNVKRDGTPYLLKTLQEHRYLTSRQPQNFRSALEELKYLKAAMRVKEYETTLQDPTFAFSIDVKTASTSSGNGAEHNHQRTSFENMAEKVTNPSQRMADDSPLPAMSKAFEATYSTPINDSEKGSIKIRVTVKTIESLERLTADIRSGKLSQQCSKILFPNEELPLEITFDEKEVESIYAQLKEMYGIRNCAVMKESKPLSEDPYIVRSDSSVCHHSEQTKTLKIIDPSTEHLNSYCVTGARVGFLNKFRKLHFGDSFSITVVLCSLGPCSKMFSEFHEGHTGQTMVYQVPGGVMMVARFESLEEEKEGERRKTNKSMLAESRAKLSLFDLCFVPGGVTSKQGDTCLHTWPVRVWYDILDEFELDDSTCNSLQNEQPMMYEGITSSTRSRCCKQKSPPSSRRKRDCGWVSKSSSIKGNLVISEFLKEFMKSVLREYATGISFIKRVRVISIFGSGFWKTLNIAMLFVKAKSIVIRPAFISLKTGAVDGKDCNALGFIPSYCQMHTDDDESLVTYLPSSFPKRRLLNVSSSKDYTRTEPTMKSACNNQQQLFKTASAKEHTSATTDGGECGIIGEDLIAKYVARMNLASVDKCILHSAYWIPSDNYGPPRLDINDSDRERLMSSFEDICPNQGVNRVPAIPQIHKTIKLFKPHSLGRRKCTLSFPVSDGQLQEFSLLSERQKTEILRKRNFDRHVTTMADKIHQWASDMQLEMLILTNYHYQNYLKEINSFVTGQNGEFDIIAISKDVGVIFIEVSSCQGNSPRVIKQQMLKNQIMLQKHKYVFLESNRDLLDFISGINVYQFSVFPNIGANILNSYACPKHSHNIIPKDCYENDNIFEWLNERVLILTKPCLSVAQYQYLCIRYVGETSKVKVRTLHDAICTTAKKLGADFLTKQQRRVAKSKRPRQLLIGDFGTGKSLLLILKARHILSKDEKNKVCHIMCSSSFPYGHSDGRSVTKHNFIEIDGGSFPKRVSTILYRPFDKDKFNGPSKPSPLSDVLKDVFVSGSKVHVFVHEVPLTYLEQNISDIETLKQRISDKCSLWLSVTTQSKEEVATVTNLYDEKFEVKQLTYYMKMPERVINLYKALQEYVRNRFDPTETGHVLKGPEPILYLLTECSCSLNDGVPPTDALSCQCIVDRLSTVLHKVWQVLKDISANKVAFYIHAHIIGGQTYTAIYRLIREIMSKMGVSIKMWQEMTSQGEDAIAVVDDFRVLNDGKFVIVSIDPFGMNHWKPGSDENDPHIPILSKCLSQYVHISWPKSEAIMLHETELSMWEDSVRKEIGHGDVATGSSYNDSLNKILRNIKRLRDSDADCLTSMVEGGYISTR